MAKLLVIEDNRTNLELMTYLLRAFGHEVVGISDAFEGLDAARAGAFDVVISDVLMPGMDGFEIARRFKADDRLRTTPLVAVTALAMVGDRERVLEAGFDGYIAKPIEPESFVPLVQSFIAPRPVEPRTPLVLAVDDIQVNLDVIEGTLRPSGFRVALARGKSEALAAIGRERPDVILSDLHMPGGDGFGLIEAVKADPRLADIPFLFLSSTGWRTADQRRGMELGARKFLIRPIEPSRLVEEVRAALDQVHDGKSTDS